MNFTITLALLALQATSVNLATNPFFDQADGTGQLPQSYSLTGNARWAWVGYSDETRTHGVSLNAYAPGGQATGEVSQMVRGIDQAKGKWLTFSFRGRAEDGFTVANDQFQMKIDFYAKAGGNYIDSAQRLIYREVLRDRKDFAVNGNDHKSGAAAWRTYQIEELIPFSEVDSVKLTVQFKNGNAGSDKSSKFFLQDFSLTQRIHSTDGKVEPSSRIVSNSRIRSADGMIPLGGRWFYLPASGERVPVDSTGHLKSSIKVDFQNADRLFYRDDKLENPFAKNMTAWLRKGYLDTSGALVTEDRFLPENVVIEFDGSKRMRMHVRNIPNHPTAVFPDTVGTQGYNPSYIQAHSDVYILPVEPNRNPSAVAMTDRDSNGALNMGPVGLAVNGVVFYNPFDANMIDASNIMDRCCGHPSPDNRYHYHKYPICVNTPFVDKGEAHSPVIGFALDGFPVYGPYESAGVMAKDLKENPLDAFNAHYDKVRGWHYHATPGKFPYIIGGYMGVAERHRMYGR